MGWNTVAVIMNDACGDIREDTAFGASLARGILRMNNGSRVDVSAGCHVNALTIISHDHADGYQVCVTHGNTGWRVGADENPPPDDVLSACANALRAHGWRVDKPKR